MIYNSKYDLYIDNDFVIYYWNNKLDKLVQRTIYDMNGYLGVLTKIGTRKVSLYMTKNISGT